MSPRSVLVLAILTYLLSSTPDIARAQAGALDPSFGTGGLVVTDFGRAADEALALAVQPDGKILAVGSARAGEGEDFGIVRYQRDGFQDGPRVNVDFHPGQRLNDAAVAVAVQPDGRIVVGGRTSSDAGRNNDFGIVRLRRDLTLDPTFGTGGLVITDFFGGFDLATDMVLQPDGRIVMLGMIENAAGQQDFGLARYNADGTLDASFGIGGRVVTDLSLSEIPYAAALQRDGKIVVVGSTYHIGSAELSMVRYLPDGTLDPGFGTGGAVFLNNYAATPYAVTIQPDGRIVAAGAVSLSGPRGSDFLLWRFHSHGPLDASFGAGRIFTDFGGADGAKAVALQSDGKVVAAGFSGTPGDFRSLNFAVARYNPDGTLDAGFGAGGRTLTDFFGERDSGQDIVIQPGRGILVGGVVGNPGTGSSDFGLARYGQGQEPNRPPVISRAAASPSALWPPNHKMVDVTVGYDVEDDSDPAPACALSVTSNEPVNGVGDGDTSPDWEVVDTHRVRLRSERTGKGAGRVYTVTITCGDAAGAVSRARVLVQVSKPAK